MIRHCLRFCFQVDMHSCESVDIYIRCENKLTNYKIYVNDFLLFDSEMLTGGGRLYSIRLVILSSFVNRSIQYYASTNFNLTL